MPHVLVAEDDPDISVPLVRALGREGYDVTHVTDGRAALEAALGGSADLLVLDLGLPGLDGLDVCRSLRGRGSTLPVLVLTARTDEPDLVVGLDAGADDYVAKPFRLAEFLARVRVQLRRAQAAGGDADLVGPDDIVVEVRSRRVTVDREEVALTPKEYDLLVALLRHAGSVLAREDLMREVWHTEWFGATKTLDMHISTLRRKLGAAGGCITTVRGVGFRIDEGD